MASPGNVSSLLKICMLVLNKKLGWTVCHLKIFNCNAGVRQGENLSSFSLYINNLDRYLIEKGITGLEKISKDIEDDFSIFMKLFKFCM